MSDPSSIHPADLPSPPQSALKIMRACSSEEVNVNEIATIVNSDPLLTVELLRIVNTPLFGFARKIQSVSQAISILGQRALRNIVLCLSVRDVINKNAIPGLDTTELWEDALRRAASARLLGEQLQLDKEECFTNGLLQDFGLLVMFFLNPDTAIHWPELQGMNPDARYLREQELFGTSHTDVIMLLTQAWSLPDELGQLFAAHHHCEQATLQDPALRMCQLLFCADWINAVFTVAAKGVVLKQTRQLLARYFSFDDETITQILSAVPADMETSASALGLHIRQQANFDQIMSEANARLAEANLSYQELTWQLEQTLKERDQLAAELDKELQLAREIQESLLPKNLSDDFPVHAINISARELSGDFYDFFELKDGRIFFNLADVSGKGINAALLMAKTSSLFHCLGKQIHDPARLLYVVNNELCETATRGMFVTMIAGIYEPETGLVHLVNAGHPPALLLASDGSVKPVEAMASPLGILSDSPYPNARTLSLADGGLYLFSDGLTEAELRPGEMLGVDGLLKLIFSLRKLPPARRLYAIVEKFRNVSEKLRDDLTILLIEEARH